ncbi:glutamine amidotransferase [Tessaracoccus palaemonis]|uniref:Glutamine amidotransferase n=1 Tax=Tessaracoccus palaemonis TaxID=2829499 RepID=A0ABX8SM64_9ACTN|nr:glutamine amidotransferase [Tessaracoccus palaemonis]QXT63994.1 glutamine amidotransferase [Tessaracoccus palaemonis]
MKPFLLLSTRPEDEAVMGEREAILRFSGLAEQDLVQYRVERESLPPIDLGDFSGILLGGGPFNSSDRVKSGLQLRVEADLAPVVAAVVARDFPFLGLCYGIGALTANLGGQVDRTFGEAVGVVDVTLTDEGRADALFDGVPGVVRAFVGHKEACTVLPPGAVLLATGADCPVQAFRVGRNIYATQFHPDLDGPGLARRIDIYQEAGYFPPAETDELMRMALAAPLSPEVHLLVRNFVERAAS